VGKLVSASIVDPPLGPETEAFFDSVLEYLAKVPPSGVPMGEDVSKLCDLNRDGRCDAADVQIFQNAVGTCRGEVGYDPLADIDGSGCVDASDHFDLFEADRDGGVDMTTVKKKKPGQKKVSNDLDKLWSAFVAAAILENPMIDADASKEMQVQYTSIARASNVPGLDFATLLEHTVIPVWNKIKADERNKLAHSFVKVATEQQKIITAATAAKIEPDLVSTSKIQELCTKTPPKAPQFAKAIATHVKFFEALIADKAKGFKAYDSDKLKLQKVIEILKPMSVLPTMDDNAAANYARLLQKEADEKAAIEAAQELAKSRQARKDAEADKDARLAANAARVMSKGKGKNKNGATA
jgi:hypothetical protein